MTARERLLAVLRGESPKVTSWAPYIGPPHFESMFPEYRAIGQDTPQDEQTVLDRLRFEVKFHREIGADVGKWSSVFHEIRHSKVKVRQFIRDGDHIVEYETPIGAISHILRPSTAGDATCAVSTSP